MNSRIWGPFQPLPGCRLWLSENCDIADGRNTELNQIEAESLLNPRDMARWIRYRPIAKKRQFLNSRAAIRDVLAREFGPLAEALHVDTLESGQPILRNKHGHDFMGISLSHSGNLNAIAFSNDQRGIGVDIEEIQSARTCDLRPSFLNHDELEWLARHGQENSRDITLAIWTMKEAIWKALGGPLDLDVTQIATRDHLSNLELSRRTDKTGNPSSSSRFFGYQVSFPSTFTNFTSVDCFACNLAGFVGCVVLGKSPHS